MARTLSIGLIFVILVWGISLLNISPIYKITNNNPIFLYKGHLLILLAIILAFKHQLLENKLIWVADKIHRAISAIAVLGIIGIEGIMHILSMPHIEGWWVSIIASSSLFSLIYTKFCSHFSKQPCNEKPSVEKIANCKNCNE